MKTASAGTRSTRTPKRELIAILNAETRYWETIRVKHGKWYATAHVNTHGRPRRASATNERQAMENLCKRLGVL